MSLLGTLVWNPLLVGLLEGSPRSPTSSLEDTITSRLRPHQGRNWQLSLKKQPLTNHLKSLSIRRFSPCSLSNTIVSGILAFFLENFSLSSFYQKSQQFHFSIHSTMTFYLSPCSLLISFTHPMYGQHTMTRTFRQSG